ncbi:alpha/beta fold hydrolase [Nonomuraea sp. NEAU-A123]|uniref:alpha/beta fold hydrolase n=1 Tax=Nonomuraea sp. NEAU-A123 TaxID=2839649 RepID=UPI001BE4624A|nr:alpha/beta hydrolase [Nonomuraea sp. NEAU-A123]MBT2227049.1 alpha/beta fold hydrolase [Nonomuraea sp. NEAU-A123]
MFQHPNGRHHEIRGHRLWVEQDGAGHPVVLLAGLGPAGSHVVFHPHFDAPAAEHRVIYVDLHGRGRSDRPADLGEITFAGDVADVAALLTELGPAHLYGFSYGGLIAQAVALEHPHLVSTLTLANTLHSPEMWQLNHANINRELAAQLPEAWERIQALRRSGLRSTDEPMRAEFAAAAPLIRFYDPANAALLVTEPGARNEALYPLFCGDDVDFVIGGQVPAIPDFRPRLKEIAVPLMVLAGRYDRALYPALQLDFQRFAPQARFEMLERSGSFGHVEEPETVLGLLRDFWRSV